MVYLWLALAFSLILFGLADFISTLFMAHSVRNFLLNILYCAISFVLALLCLDAANIVTLS